MSSSHCLWFTPPFPAPVSCPRGMWSCGAPKEQKVHAGIGMGHIGKLVGALPLYLGEQNREVRVLEDVFSLRAGKKVLHLLR